MRQHILTTAFAAAVTALAYGQNLNPTVEVTNIYEGGAAAIAKPLQQMAVPDSVKTFNLDFDYSVFDNPYQGAYEFKPYYVQLRPASRYSTEEKFYLRLGAGFTLHPELDLVWSPLRTEKTRVNVYATHRSYFGRYHRIGVLDPVGEMLPLGASGEKVNGYLADTKAGVDGSFHWSDGVATLNTGFLQRAARNDALRQQRSTGGEVQGRVRSLERDEPHFMYDAALSYRYLGNSYSNEYLNVVYSDISGITVPTVQFGESLFNFDGSFGPVMGPDQRIVAEVNLDIASYSRDLTGYTGALSVTPKYIFNLDNWHFSLGVRLGTLVYSDGFAQIDETRQHKGAHVFPDVFVDFHLLDDRLVLQASATGGNRLNTESSLFFSRPFSVYNECCHSVERIRAMVGARGNIAGKFRYDLQGGFARQDHALVDAVDFLGDVPYPALLDYGFNKWFATLDYGWNSDHVTVDGKLAYNGCTLTEPRTLSPSTFTGFIRPAYHWGERFKAGMDVSWATARKASVDGVDLYVPGWLDLGLFAEYRFTRQFGFWAKGGNLLNQAVQRMPIVAEAGMFATVGILLNF